MDTLYKECVEPPLTPGLTWKWTATLAHCTFGWVELLWIIELSFAALGNVRNEFRFQKAPCLLGAEAEDEEHGIDDVGLAAAVGPHDAREALVEGPQHLGGVRGLASAISRVSRMSSIHP